MQTILKIVPYILFYILLSTPAYALWKGKLPPVSEDLWIYADDSGERNVAFIEFENLSDADNYESFDSFRLSFPRTLAETIKDFKTIPVPPDDYKPVFTNVNKYKKYSYSFEEVAEQQALEKQASLAAEQGKAGAEADAEEPSAEKSDTDEKAAEEVEKPLFDELIASPEFAYTLTNSEGYTVYLFQGEENYIDANLVDEEYAKTLSVPIRRTKEGLRYFAINSTERKKLLVSEDLYLLDNISLLDALADFEGDYLIYGTFRVERVTVLLNLYVLDKNKQRIVHIAKEEFSSLDVSKNLEKLAVTIIAAISQRPVVENTHFQGNKDAFLLLNNKIIGRLPLTIKYLLSDTYSYRVWDRDKELLKSESALPLDETTLDISKSDATVNFTIAEKEKGYLQVRVRNNLASYFYLNHLLVAAGKTSIEETLQEGEYYLRVERDSFEPAQFYVNILPGKRTELELSLKKLALETRSAQFIGYESTKKIFAALGFTLGAVGLVLQFDATDIEDRRDAVRGNIDDGQTDEVTREYERSLGADYNKAVLKSALVLSSSLISFLLTGIFHMLDIWEERAPIATEYQKSSTYNFEYIDPLEPEK